MIEAAECLTPREQGRERAELAGLSYVNGFDRGITRRRCGRGFTYLTVQGETVKSPQIRKRIQSLVIPPAWNDVWICPQANGHIQARGLDEEERLQYIYHALWQALSSSTKYERLPLLATLLPRIRRRIRKDLSGEELTRERVLAAVIRLMDKTYIRVGNECYAKERGSRGATTLTSEHVEVDQFTISLDFPGKSGQRQQIRFSDRLTAGVVRECVEIDGQYLFCYLNAAGESVPVSSTDVNNALREIAGEPVSAKDFRTWWGTVVALSELKQLAQDATLTERKQAVRQAVAAASTALGNTKAVCRKSYIHPELLTAAESGDLPGMLTKAARIDQSRDELTADEVTLAQLLQVFAKQRA